MSRVLVRHVLDIVVARYDVTEEELRSVVKARRVSRPRLILYWLARRLTGQSLPAIGRALGRDHTSILSGVRRLDDERSCNPALARELALLELAARADAGAATHPADRCLPAVDAVHIARRVLVQNGKALDRWESVALARAYLTAMRAAGSPPVGRRPELALLPAEA